MKKILVLAICSLGLADLGFAQQPVVELEGGGGYLFGSGGNPSLRTLNAAIVVWPGERWGVGVQLVEGPGEDLYQPVESYDRTFLGVGHLRYYTITARYRRPMSQDLGFRTQ